ncbi:MAG: Transcriptional regulatory protein DegU [Candidatus Dichloromethanomonas elyunquensis]|nr:MAG: Transcriptional regulatory protein DegU [Candidatus Dichloromethanomonas elyunquensis]
MQSIRVLIVDDVRNTRESIRRILGFDSDFEVVGEAGCGSDALRLAELLKPDIVLMDISMPDIDGIKTSELLSFRVPNTSVIIMSVEKDSDHMTKAMLAGAKAYIVKPFTGNEVVSTILNVYHKEARKREIINSPSIPQTSEKESTGKIISIFSTKGGVGKTTTAVNLGVELRKSHTFRVLLMDLSLQFGDIASFLNLVPKRTISDLAQVNPIKEEDIRFHILSHSSGVDVLAASTRPEYAEMVTPEHVQQILKEIKLHYDFILCDNSARFDDISLTSLEAADEIWLIAGMDIPAIKNTKIALEILYSLDYTPKIKLILNQYNRRIGINLKEIESSLGKKIDYVLPEEEQLTSVLNKGIPFVKALPRSAMALETKKMAKDLSETAAQKSPAENEKNKGTGLQKILGLGR